MADRTLPEILTHFQNAVYGKDVRQDIVDLANVLTDNLNDALEHELATVDATLTQSGAGADAKVVGDRFAAVENGISEARAAIPAIDATLTQAGQTADAKAVGDEISTIKRNSVRVDATLTESGKAADAAITGGFRTNHAQRIATLEGTTATHTTQIASLNTTLGTKADASTVTDLANDLDALEDTVAELPSDLSGLGDRIGAVETTIPTLATKAELSAAESALDGRLDTVEATLPTLATKEVTYPLIERISRAENLIAETNRSTIALDTRLDTVEATLPTLATKAELSTAESAIDGRLDTVEATLPTLATKTELNSAVTALDGRLDTVEATIPTLATKAELATAETAIYARIDEVEDEIPTKISDLEDDKGLLVVGHDVEIQTLQIGDPDLVGSFYRWVHIFVSSSALVAFWTALVNEQGNICFIKRGGAKLQLVYDAENEIFSFNARTDHSRVDPRQSYVHIQKTGAKEVTFYFDENRSDDMLAFVAAKVRYLTANDGVAKTADLADVATSGDYADLANTPTIPSKASDLINDRGYLNETTAEQKGFLRNKIVEETETIGNADLESLSQLTDADGYPVFYGWYATSSTRTWPAALWSALVSASSDGTVYYEDSNGVLKPLTYDSANSRFSYNLNSPTAGLPAANELHRSVSNEPGILIYYLPDNGETDEMHIFLTDNRSDQRIYFFGKTTYEDNYMKERIVDRVTGTVYKIVVRNGQIALDAV